MQFDSLAEFISMGGYGPFVWTVYGLGVLVFLINVFAPLRARKQFFKQQHQAMQRMNARQQVEQNQTVEPEAESSGTAINLEGKS